MSQQPQHAWQPNQDGLAELVQLFRDSQDPQPAVQERIAHVSEAESSALYHTDTCT